MIRYNVVHDESVMPGRIVGDEVRDEQDLRIHRHSKVLGVQIQHALNTTLHRPLRLAKMRWLWCRGCKSRSLWYVANLKRDL